MWMTDYIREIKRQFRDVYGFVPDPESAPHNPTFRDGAVPPGVYAMTIDGRVDHVLITKDYHIRVRPGNFEETHEKRTKSEESKGR